MATAEQIKSLVKAYVEQDNDKFKTITLQIAAYEAKLGHQNFAQELKKQMDKLSIRRPNILQITNKNPMLLTTFPNNKLSDLIVSEDTINKIKRILNEYHNKNKLHSYGLTNRRKILIEGNPGTGKTLTASIIASELSLPLYTVQMDKLITKFMGETSAKLRQIFDSIQSSVGVYFFDEFDAIGANRSLDNEVGEMRRILNSFLQFIEQDASESLIIAATNNSKLLDQALFRRFDDVLHYSLPNETEIQLLFEHKLVKYDNNFKITKNLTKNAYGLNHAEIVRICNDAIKFSILNNKPLTEKLILSILYERYNIYFNKEA